MNGQHKKDIEYHSHDQRKHYRLTTPFWIKVEDKTYQTKDWSVGGLSIKNFHREVENGEVLNLSIIIKFQGFNIGFDATAKAIGTKNNTLRLKFEKLSDRSKNILQFFSQSIISGEMVDFEDTIKRIDMPINLQEDNIEQYRKDKPPFRRWPFKAVFFTTFYLTAGLLLFIYLCIIIYGNFVHLKVDTGVISASIETVVSPFDGIVEKLYVSKNMIVDAQDPLMQIKDHELDHALTLEMTNHEQAKTELNLKNKLLESEKNKLNIYETIGKNKHTEFESNLKEWEERHEKVDNDHQRALALYRKKVISKAEMDKFEAEWETVKHQLDEAKHQLNTHKLALGAVETGHYFSEDTLQGEIPLHEANVEHAKNQIEISAQKIDTYHKQINERLLKAPFHSQIIDVFKSTGNTVSTGDKLMLLERDEKRKVTAYLTQNEIVEINKDAKVNVYIPAIKKTIVGQIESIDRSEGYIDRVSSDYKGRSIDEPTAKIVITFPNISKEELQKDLAPGNAAVVYFDRSLFDNIKNRVKMYFSPNQNR